MSGTEDQNSNQQTTSTGETQNLEDQSTEVTTETEDQVENQNDTQSESKPAVNKPDPAILALYDNVLREKEAELQRLRDQLETKPVVPELTPDEQKQKFFNNPMDVLRQEINAALSPLLDFASGVRKETEYDRLKTRFKNDARYSDVFPQIEGYVDQIMSKSEMTDQNMRTAILVAIGALHSGEIVPTATQTSTQTTTQTNNTNQNRIVTPPHLRSSPPNAPKTTKKSNVVLTELEKRLARERGMSESDYIKFRDAKPSEVINVQ